MPSARGQLARTSGFALVTVVFAVTQPVLLAGLPLALLLVAYGPYRVGSAMLVGVALIALLAGDRAGLWWFERGWALVLAGVFVWVVGWKPRWRFFEQALAALWLAAGTVALIFALWPSAWQGVDTLMAQRAGQAVATAGRLLGGSIDADAAALVRRVVDMQVAVFPALLGVSSLGALGVAVTVRSWLSGRAAQPLAALRAFRFNDHLVWLWLAGLLLIVAPIGGIGDRIGGNFVFFMGALYAVRGLAVLLSVIGGISVLAGVVGGIVAVVIYPILAFLLVVMVVVGLGDTWLDVRDRVREKIEGR